jgi:hypothetical protein
LDIDSISIASSAKAEEVFSMLKKVAMARNMNFDIQRLWKQGSAISCEYYGVLEQVLQNIVTKTRPLLRDIKHIETAGVGGILNRGWGFLGYGASIEPHPSNSSCIIIFILGGFSCKDISIVREIAAKNPQLQVRYYSVIFLLFYKFL